MGRNTLAGHIPRLGNLGHTFHQRFGGHDKQLGHLLLERHGADALVRSSTRDGRSIFGALALAAPSPAESSAPFDPSPAQPPNARLPPAKAANHTKRRRVMESAKTVTLLPSEQLNPFEPIAHALAISLTPTSIAARNALRQRAAARCRST